MTLIIVSVFIGALCIGSGFWIVNNPDAAAKRINIPGIKGYRKLDEPEQIIYLNFVKKTFIIAGLVTVLGGVISSLLKLNIMAVIFLFAPMMIMAIVISLKGMGRTMNRIAAIAYILFCLALLIGIPAMLSKSSQEPNVFFENENLRITGSYGETIPVKNIADITLLEQRPKIGMRTNGFAAGTVRKGHFKMDGIGKVKLFIMSNSGPYIRIQTVDRRTIFINFKNSEKTVDIYEKIRNPQ